MYRNKKAVLWHLPIELHDKLKALARNDLRNVNAEAVILLEDGVNKEYPLLTKKPVVVEEPA